MLTKDKTILLLCFLAIISFNSFEIYEEFVDYFNSDTWEPFNPELFLVIICFFATIYIAYSIIKQVKAHVVLEESLVKVRTQLDSSNIRLREGKKEYQEVIKWQFAEWNLSKSEKEVALLLLKGLSIKDIADVRSTKEKTVRGQASAIYDKSNLNGRHELSAWFFEDML